MATMDLNSRDKSRDPEKETRTVEFNVTVETRADGKKRLRGHAAVFNEETIVAGWFREKILPGAFIDTIVEDDQRALWNHDPNYVLGRKNNDTLTLSEDKRGLAIEIDPPDTQLIRDLVISPIERGDVNKMSFSFKVVPLQNGQRGEEWQPGGDDGLLDLRVIKKCRVFDVSPVTFPAYEGTDIAFRSHSDWQKENINTQEPTPEEEQESRCSHIELLRRKIQLKTMEDK